MPISDLLPALTQCYTRFTAAMKPNCHLPDIEAATILTRRTTSKAASRDLRLLCTHSLAVARDTRRNARGDLQALVESGRPSDSRAEGRPVASRGAARERLVSS